MITAVASGKKGIIPTESILQSISDGVFTVDLTWRITSLNRAAEEITGVCRIEAIGRRCSEVFCSSMCGAACPLRQIVKTLKHAISKSGYFPKAAMRNQAPFVGTPCQALPLCPEP